MKLKGSNNSEFRIKYYINKKSVKKQVIKSYIYESVSQGHIIGPTHGPKKLTEEASLHKKRSFHKQTHCYGLVQELAMYFQ